MKIITRILILLGIFSLLLSGYSAFQIPFVKITTDDLINKINNDITDKKCFNESEQKRMDTWLRLIKWNHSTQARMRENLRLTASFGYGAFALIFFVLAYKIKRFIARSDRE